MTRILIVDHQLIAEGLELLLQPHFTVVGTTADAVSASSLAGMHRPHIILMDFHLPLAKETARQVQTEQPGIKIIFLCQAMNSFSMRAALRLGAFALIPKHVSSQQLMEAIRTVASAKTHVFLGDNMDRPTGAPTGTADLSARLTQVLRHIAEGKTTKEIAALLEISPKTVEFHKSKLMDRLGIRTIAGLTVNATERGLLDGNDRYRP